MFWQRHKTEHRMITLITYPGNNGLFSFSPFCVKAAYFLNAAGWDWCREDTNDPRKMPYQKLPVLRAVSRLIPDSENIRRHLEDHGADFDVGLSDAEKAHSHALIRKAEEHLYFHIVLDRWGNDAVWPTIRDVYFRDIPAFLRKFVANGIRRSLLKGLRTQGLARLTVAERMDRLETDLTAITALLWRHRFLLSDHPTAADYSVGAMLGAMRDTPVETDLTRRIMDDPVLSVYIDRLGQPVAPT